MISSTKDYNTYFGKSQVDTTEKVKKLPNCRKVCKNKEYDKIYQFITEETISLNEIYKKSNENIVEINNILLMLEIEGYIEKVVGGYKCILEKR